MNGRSAKYSETEVPVDLEDLPGTEESLVHCISPSICRHENRPKCSRATNELKIDKMMFVEVRKNTTYAMTGASQFLTYGSAHVISGGKCVRFRTNLGEKRK